MFNSLVDVGILFSLRCQVIGAYDILDTLKKD